MVSSSKKDSTMTLGELDVNVPVDVGAGGQQPMDVLSMIPEIKAQLKETKELDMIREIKSLKKRIEEKRKVERQAIEEQLRELQRQRSLIAANSERGIADWRTPTLHSTEMERLNTEKFALAKANAELQVAIERLENSKVEEDERMEEVEAEDPAEGMDLDRDALALRVLRQIGFRPLYPTAAETASITTTGAPFHELTVTSKKRDTTVLINVSDSYMRSNEISAIAMADQLWKAVS